jgi:YggT family protein
MQVLLQLINTVLAIYTWVVFFKMVMVWLKGFNLVSAEHGVTSVIDRFLGASTAPFLTPMRAIAPPRNEVDVSPLFLILILMAVRYWISIYLIPAYA